MQSSSRQERSRHENQIRLRKDCMTNKRGDRIDRITISPENTVEIMRVIGLEGCVDDGIPRRV